MKEKVTRAEFLNSDVCGREVLNSFKTASIESLNAKTEEEYKSIFTALLDRFNECINTHKSLTDGPIGYSCEMKPSGVRRQCKENLCCGALIKTDSDNVPVTMSYECQSSTATKADFYFIDHALELKKMEEDPNYAPS